MRNSALIIFEVQKRRGLQVLDLGASKLRLDHARAISFRRVRKSSSLPVLFRLQELE